MAKNRSRFAASSISVSASPVEDERLFGQQRIAHLDYLQGRVKVALVRQGQADQVGPLAVQHLTDVGVGPRPELGGPRLCLFYCAPDDGAELDVAALREDAGVLPAPTPGPDEGDFDVFFVQLTSCESPSGLSSSWPI